MLPFSCCRPLLARCINHSSLLATPLANILSSSSSIGGGAKVGHRREKERSPKIGEENHLRVCFSYEGEEENSEASINLPISLPELWRGFILKGLEHFSQVSWMEQEEIEFMGEISSLLCFSQMQRKFIPCILYTKVHCISRPIPENPLTATARLGDSKRESLKRKVPSSSSPQN